MMTKISVGEMLKRPYGITSEKFGHVESAEVLLEAGFKGIQVRCERSTPTRRIMEIADRVADLAEPWGALVIVNNDVMAARDSKADGVHLGQEDARVETANLILKNKIIGVSVSTPAQAMTAQNEGATYLSAGLAYNSRTKPCGDVIGPGGIRNIKRFTNLPVIAIGGIRLWGLTEMHGTGIDSVAVMSDIYEALDPVGRAKEIERAWRELRRA